MSRYELSCFSCPLWLWNANPICGCTCVIRTRCGCLQWRPVSASPLCCLKRIWRRWWCQRCVRQQKTNPGEFGTWWPTSSLRLAPHALLESVSLSLTIKTCLQILKAYLCQKTFLFSCAPASSISRSSSFTGFIISSRTSYELAVSFDGSKLMWVKPDDWLRIVMNGFSDMMGSHDRRTLHSSVIASIFQLMGSVLCWSQT